MDEKDETIQKLKNELARYKENETEIKATISSLSDRVIRGDLEKRLDLSKFPKRLQIIGKNINKMVDFIQLNTKELKKAQEYASNLIRNAPNPISVMTPDGKRRDTNIATEKLFKRSRKEIIGAKIEELYEKEDLEKVKNALEESKKMGFSSCEVTCIKGDKSTFPAVLNFSLVKDEKGNIVNVLITATDISELRKHEEELNHAVTTFGNVLSKAAGGDLSARMELNAIGEDYIPIGENLNSMIEETGKREEELEESNRFNQRLIENLPVAIWMADEGGKCCLVNREFIRLLGWTREELLGTHTPNFPYVCESGLPYIEEGTVEALSKIWEHTIEKKEFTTGIVPFLTKDGKIVIHRGVEISYGKEEARLWASVDITELKKREEKLKKLIKKYEEYIGPVAKTIAKDIVEAK